MRRRQSPAGCGKRRLSPSLRRLLLAAAALAAALPALPTIATVDDGMSHQRADIAAQRQAVQRRFDEKARDCQQRFAVTACVNAAQKERREALLPLRQEEIRIDTLQRKQRAATRLEEIEAKQRLDAAKEAAAASAAASSAATGAHPLPRAAKGEPPNAGKAGPRPSAPITGLKPRPPVSEEERQRREAASLARYQANQAAAQQRREAADARNAKRAAAGKPVRPLPAPEGSASAP